MYHVLIVVCMYLHLECTCWTTCTCILIYMHILWTHTVIPHLMYMYMRYSGPHCGAPCTRFCTLMYNVMLDPHCNATCICILLTHTLHKMLHNVKLLGRKYFLCGCIAECESFLHKFWTSHLLALALQSM